MALKASRRAALAAIGGLLTAGLGAARAQPAKPVIGVLNLPTRVPPSEPYYAAFEKGFADAGFAPGTAITIEYRFANNRPDQLRKLAQELVAAGATIIVTPSGLSATRAAQEVAPAAPIVTIFTSDPVQPGLIVSLNRPGGNITGVIVPGEQMLDKQLELARELVPGKARVGLLADEVYTQPLRDRASSTADNLGLDLVIAAVANERDIDAAFGSFAGAGLQCLVAPASPLMLTRHEQIVALAAANHLPDIYAPSDILARGGLMSYGPVFPELWHLLGAQTAKILAGAKPSDLPVVFPARIELRVNLRVARERGIAIPPEILTRADSVIE